MNSNEEYKGDIYDMVLDLLNEYYYEKTNDELENMLKKLAIKQGIQSPPDFAKEQIKKYKLTILWRKGLYKQHPGNEYLSPEE